MGAATCLLLGIGGRCGCGRRCDGGSRSLDIGIKKLNDLFGYDLEEMPKEGKNLPIGKGRVLKEADEKKERKDKVCIVSIGTRLAASIEAAREIEAAHPDVSVTVADARWMKPLDTDRSAPGRIEGGRLKKRHQIDQLAQKMYEKHDMYQVDVP